MSRPPWLTDARKNLRKTGLDTEGKDQDGIPGTFHQSGNVSVPHPDTMTVAATTGTNAKTDTAIAAGVVHGPVGSKITTVVYKDTEEPLKHNLRRLENKLKIHQRQLCDMESNIQKLENDLEQQQDSATRDDVPNAEEQICQLEDEIKMHKSEIARLENEVLPDLMAKRDEVKEQLDKHEQTSQDKMDDIPVLKEKMQSLIKDLEKYGTDVAREREKVAHLSRLIGKLDKDFKQKETDEKMAIQELKTQVETIRAEQVKQSLQLQDEMKDLQEWKKEMQKQHDERLREVQDRLREEKTARESAERTIQELKDRHARDVDNSQAPSDAKVTRNERGAKVTRNERGTKVTRNERGATSVTHATGIVHRPGATQKASRSDPTPNVTLLDACRAGDVDEVRNIVGQRGVSLNCRGVCRDTPVIVAAEKGHTEIVKLLVNDGADVTLLNDVGNNILHVACRGSDVDMVKFLLSLNMLDINSRGWRNRTPVLEAAVNGRRDVVEVLMSEGADVSMGDDDGNSTLHLACVGGYVETVKFVLSQNVVDIDARNTLGQTAAAVARSRGHQHLVDLLMSHSGQ